MSMIGYNVLQSFLSRFRATLIFQLVQIMSHWNKTDKSGIIEKIAQVWGLKFQSTYDFL